jgi:MFS family permease
MRLHPRLGLLLDHDYRQLFASTTVSQFGVHVTQLAIPLVAIIALDATPFEVGALAAVAMAPFLLVGLPAGAWVDRMRRRVVLIVGDLARAALLATVPLAWWADLLTIWQLYAVAFLTGVFTVFFDVAYQSYLPHLVGRDNLVEGNAKLESVRALAQLGGPALAGQLIRLLTAPVALLVDAIAMAGSALFVTQIRKREERPARRPDAHLVREIREGLGFVLGHRLLRAIVACTGSFNLCFAAYGAMLILFLERVLGLDAGGIGLVFTLSGAGGLLGAFAARRVADRVGQGPALWLSAAVAAPPALLMPLLAEPGWRLWVAAAAGSVVSAGVVVYNVTQVSFRQGLTPDHLLGRMNATVRFLVWGTMPLGAILGGVLGELVGVRAALLISAAAGCLAFLPVFLSPLRTMRAMPTQPTPPSAQEGAPLTAAA